MRCDLSSSSRSSRSRLAPLLSTLPRVLPVAFAALVPLAAACSSSSPSGTTASDDAGSAADTATVPTGDDAADSATTPLADAGGTCSAARDNLLRPVNASSKGAVTVLSDTGGVKTLYVDASAGGTQGADNNPRVYVSLATDSRVDLTDPAAETSTAWDVAIKRAVLYTNGGDGGPGKGGAVLLDGKDFASVTSADAASATFSRETFFDKDCNPSVDATGDVLTSFSGWYDYNQQQHTLAVHPGTFLVKGASGAIYKLAIVTYYGEPDGGTSPTGGYYVLKVAAL